VSVFVYDSGALIAIDGPRGSKAVRKHLERLLQSDTILVPAVAAAQVLRDPARQVRLMRALNSSKVVPFRERDVWDVGRLLAASGTADVVDACVALVAARDGATVITSDPADISKLLTALGAEVAIAPA
jgi:predicted nucleic acid-binding protein